MIKFNTPIQNRGTTNVQFMFRQIEDDIVLMDIIKNDAVIYSDIMTFDNSRILFDRMTADD